MGNVTQVKMIKIHYLGDAEEPTEFVGVATKTPYQFGGRINLGEVDARDLSIGRSTHPGLLELDDDKGQKLFEMWTPLQEQKAKREAEARAREVRKAAEALAVREPAKKARKVKAARADDEDPDTSD